MTSWAGTCGCCCWPTPWRSWLGGLWAATLRWAPGGASSSEESSFSLLTLVLLRGVQGVPVLQPVSVIYWGGLMLNLLLAVVGIVLSLPLGIALALGRRGNLPIVKLLCVVFIEVFRGVPLITLLFMSQVLVPLAFPEGFPVNSLLRAGVVITLFSAAYMAENVRGGLQALNPGQMEAARSLGLPGWQTTIFISLPASHSQRHTDHRRPVHFPVQGYQLGVYHRDCWT